MFIFTGSLIIKQFSSISETSNEIIDSATTDSNNDLTSNSEVSDFNRYYENYIGVQTGSIVKSVLNNIVSDITSEGALITVIYDDNVYNAYDDVTLFYNFTAKYLVLISCGKYLIFCFIVFM